MFIFQCRARLGRVSKKIGVAGRFGSGKSGEIFDRLFPGSLFSLSDFRVLRYYRVFWVPDIWVIPNISGYLIPDDFEN